MEKIPDHFKIQLDPAPNPDAVVLTSYARFTILTSRLVRMEWSSAGHFEDRASQAFWFRTQPTPDFTVLEGKKNLVIETDALRLTYVMDAPFSADTLSIYVKAMDTTWQFGDPDPGNLGGTARTLDGVDGATPIGLGLISRSGWSLVDDSNSLVFSEVGWLQPREAPVHQLDLYFFGYGHAYIECLRDFNLVSGAVPMIPRFVLGNWWSRYWQYSQDELSSLMETFQSYEVPLAVCIIDMDWHITNTNNQSTGWTGYTWNRTLFPDPEGFLAFLHQKGLKAGLNLHPAEGIHNHEEMYAEMSEAVGNDPQKGEPVEFDITNPRFVEAYFRILHHRQEAIGVDFWWMDWQQGARTRLSGLDPLWWLNHLHFLDLGRDGKRRSFIFSRWGGLGNHRYPIGFSGDSVVSWASLAFQPYFTATASNVNYGWWSHDIGGHMGGVEDAELYTRWVQLAVFLPILRLHSTKNLYHERAPWGYDAETLVAARNALQLRHALIPYLYSLAWRYHHESIPPLLPMYYDHPEEEAAYACPNQYQFGADLIVAPFITPQDADTRLSRAVVWLPEGDWYDFFNGQYYPGNGWHALYGTQRDTPVFAKAGAIIPRGPMAGWDNIQSPEHLLLQVYPGADGAFDLYEDEGNTNAYLEGAYALTPLRQTYTDGSITLTVGPAQGAEHLVPAQRKVTVLFRGVVALTDVKVTLNGKAIAENGTYDAPTRTFTLNTIVITPTDRLEVHLGAGEGEPAAKEDARLATCERLLRHFRMESWSKMALHDQLAALMDDAAALARFLPQLKESQLRALLETITGAGIEDSSATGNEQVVVWNNHADPQVRQLFALARNQHFWLYKERYPYSSDVAPRFMAYRPLQDFGEGNPWVIQLNYYGMHTIQFSRE